MTQDRLDHWLTTLGYSPASPSLHRPSSALTSRHAYAPELHDLLNPAGEIRAEAVFDVEGVPTVGFFVDDGGLLSNELRLVALRQRIWNQGLISVLLVITDAGAVPVPVPPKHKPGHALAFHDARADGPLSRADIESGDIRERHSDWFRQEDRVDRRLLANLRTTVDKLSVLFDTDDEDEARQQAQYLVGQALFVSYLEHRGIVGERYRATRNVGTLHALVKAADRSGLVRLVSQLKKNFNGDFLEPPTAKPSLWEILPKDGFHALDDLLAATDIERGQPDFFPYNFRYIPVELLAGIYESFLGKAEKKKHAAYYTPRHLANLVVDQALSGSKDLLKEKIFDGACGSGILLTTAFRRLLGEYEARRGGAPIPLRERIDLLREHIFGSDLNEAACRVTAFSLYLSLLERLQPADIADLCDDEKLKLPTLRDKNLFYDEEGNFFSKKNPHLKRQDLTLYLSNPPWMEVDDREDPVLGHWAQSTTSPRVLKQIAADFMWQASEVMPAGARVCLILPMTLLLKPTSQPFLSAWLERIRIVRTINFGDLKELLFADGRASCVVLLGERRTPVEEDGSALIPPTETFDYWVPKADVSLAFGRLTLHGVDRHEVQTQSIAQSNRELVTRMWGDEFDLALWTRLRLRGTFGQMFTGKNSRWKKRKGFHRTDNSPHAKRSPSTPFHRLRFISPAMLYDVPVVRANEAKPFPKDEIPEFTGDPDDLMEVFDGPRIVFPDGPAPDGTIRAAFLAHKACFMSSVGVIAGPKADDGLLRFAAIYLRSDLVRYFTLMQLYQLVSDRDRVSLTDIGGFPFYPPERHANPVEAASIVHAIAEISRLLEMTDPLSRPAVWEQVQGGVEKLLEQYFGLTEDEQRIVHETVHIVRPMIRPYGLSKVFENATHRVSDTQAKAYAEGLRRELDAWRDARGGRGAFTVDVRLTHVKRAGAFGVVRVQVGNARPGQANAKRSDDAVEAVLRELTQSKLMPVTVQEQIYLAPDTVIVTGNTVYLIKPQTERVWLLRHAYRDAERIVMTTLQPHQTTENAA